MYEKVMFMFHITIGFTSPLEMDRQRYNLDITIFTTSLFAIHFSSYSKIQFWTGPMYKGNQVGILKIEHNFKILKLLYLV